MDLRGQFVDVPPPGSQGFEFNIVERKQGGKCESYTADNALELEKWKTALRVTMRGLISLSDKFEVQVCPEFAKDDKGKDYTLFAVKILSEGSESLVRQRYSALEDWHKTTATNRWTTRMPAFPSKGKLVANQKSAKFVEARRLNFARYFFELLCLPGFIQSDEFDVILAKRGKAKDGGASGGGGGGAAASAGGGREPEPMPMVDMEDDAWLQMHMSGDSGSSRRTERPASSRGLDPWQGGKEPVLDSHQLDIAAYEALMLSIDFAPPSQFSPKERDALDSIRTQLGISKRQHREIHTIMSSDEGNSAEQVRESFSHSAASKVGSPVAAGGIKREGKLLKKGEKNTKMKDRYFVLEGSMLTYYKDSSKYKQTGFIDLSTASKVWRGHSGDHSNFEIMTDTRSYVLKAEDADMAQGWIGAIHGVISSNNAAEEQEDASSGYAASTNMYKLSHRFQLLMLRSPADFGPDAGKFLDWRDRQIVIYTSGLMRWMEKCIAKEPSRTTALQTYTPKLKKECERILQTRGRVVEADADGDADDDDEQTERRVFCDADMEDYGRRLTNFETLVEQIKSETGNCMANDDYIDLYPLDVSCLFYERLLLRACFEDPEMGGGEVGNVADIVGVLQRMAQKMEFRPGCHHACYAFACATQFNMVGESDALEMFGQSVQRLKMTPQTLEIGAIRNYLDKLLEFCSKKLATYRTMQDASHVQTLVPLFITIFVMCQEVDLPVKWDTNLVAIEFFIKSSTTQHYKRIVAQIDKTIGEEKVACEKEREKLEEEGVWISDELDAREANLTPMARLRQIVDVVSDELNIELADYAPLLAGFHYEASAVCVLELAGHLNRDMPPIFKAVDTADADVLRAWAGLRELDRTMKSELYNAGSMEERALNLDTVMEPIAKKWVADQDDRFNAALKNAFDKETWEPFSEDARYATSAHDIVMMLVQVAQQYFAAEFPVEESIIRDIAKRFGFVLQKYGRFTTQSCGTIPKMTGAAGGRGRQTTDTAALRANMGRLAGGALSKVSEITGAEIGVGEEPPSPSMLQSGEQDRVRLCTRLTTLQYCIDKVGDLLTLITEGCDKVGYTGKHLDDAMEEIVKNLEEHAKMVREHIAAGLVFVDLSNVFCVELYQPTPDDHRLVDALNELDDPVDDIFGEIPENQRMDMMQQILECIADAVMRSMQRHRNPGGAQELTIEHIELFADDMAELRAYFEADGQGVAEVAVRESTKGLDQTFNMIRKAVSDNPVRGKQQGGLSAVGAFARSASSSVAAATGMATVDNGPGWGAETQAAAGDAPRQSPPQSPQRGSGAGDAAGAAGAAIGDIGSGAYDAAALAQAAQAAGEKAAAAGEAAKEAAMALKSRFSGFGKKKGGFKSESQAGKW